jgi:hypothetical protein
MGDEYDFDQLLRGLTDTLSQPERKSGPQPHLVPRSGVHVPDTIAVVAIRRMTGLSQAAFASRIGVPVAPCGTGSSATARHKGQPRRC